MSSSSISSCVLRNDEQIITLNEKMASNEEHRNELLKNARFTYDDYLMAPPSKFENE